MALDKKSKIRQLYELYKANPKLQDEEAAELLDTHVKCVRIYKVRLIEKGCCQYTDSGGMEVISSYDNPELRTTPEYKAEVYRSLIDIYLDDFAAQEKFEDRLTVGREIRLLLEKM